MVMNAELKSRRGLFNRFVIKHSSNKSKADITEGKDRVRVKKQADIQTRKTIRPA